MRWKRRIEPVTGRCGHVCGDYAVIRTESEDGNEKKWKACRKGSAILYTDSLQDADAKCRALAAEDIESLFFKKLSEEGRMTDSDIMDFSEDMRRLYGNDVEINPWMWIAERETQGTICEGCFHIQSYPDFGVCTGCTRNRTHRDMYTVARPNR